jgi:hypothetical protein
VVLLMSVADGVYMYPLIGFLGLSAVAFVASLFSWWRYRGAAEQVSSAINRVQAAREDAERLLEKREQELLDEYSLKRKGWADRGDAYFDEIERMWADYRKNPAKYAGDRLSGEESGNRSKLEFIYNSYMGVGLLLAVLLLLTFTVVGLWGMAILAGVLFFLSAGWAVLDDSELRGTKLWAIPASIAASALVALLLIPVSGMATNSNPPPGWIAHTHEVTLAQQADGTYGVGEPARMRLDGTVTKSKEPDADYSWVELDSRNVKRSYDSYYYRGVEKQVRVMDDLAAGEAPYVVHHHVFNVLDGYADGEVCAARFSASPALTTSCSDRNAWSKRDDAVIHIPRGEYERWVVAKQK